jgi:hypothetical protein
MDAFDNKEKNGKINADDDLRRVELQALEFDWIFLDEGI